MTQNKMVYSDAEDIKTMGKSWEEIKKERLWEGRINW